MKAYHLYTSFPMILKAIMILKFVEFIFMPLPLSWEIPFYPYCPNAPPLGTCGPVTLYQQTSFKFPAQIKNDEKWYLLLTSFSRTIIFKEFKPLPLSSEIFFPAHPPLAECPVTLYQQTSFKFPAQIKNKDVLRQNLNFSPPGCPPPSGQLRPSDTMSTNQFQISRANKKTRMPAKSDTSF